MHPSLLARPFHPIGARPGSSERRKMAKLCLVVKIVYRLQPHQPWPRRPNRRRWPWRKNPTAHFSLAQFSPNYKMVHVIRSAETPKQTHTKQTNRHITVGISRQDGGRGSQLVPYAICELCIRLAVFMACLIVGSYKNTKIAVS